MVPHVEMEHLSPRGHSSHLRADAIPADSPQSAFAQTTRNGQQNYGDEIRFVMIFLTWMNDPRERWHPPDATPPDDLLAAFSTGGQGIAARRASIWQDLFIGSIKLSVKHALTDKSHASIGLHPVLNWSVLPFVAKGTTCAWGLTQKGRVQVWPVPA